MICIACGVRITHVPTEVAAEVTRYTFVPTYRLRDIASRIIRQRMWSHRNTQLPMKEVARYEFEGDGYIEFDKPEDILESRLSSRYAR